MAPQADSAGASKSANETFLGLTSQMFNNTALVLLGAFGAFILAAPLESLNIVEEDTFGWYPSLLGVSLMAFAAVGLLFNNTTGTIGEKVNHLRMELGSLVIASFFLLGITFAWETQTLEGVGLMGILILLGMLIGGNLLSPERALQGGEVRTALAVSIIAVFFGFIAVGDQVVDPETGDAWVLEQDTILWQTMEHFWKVLIAVVGFYFGSLAVESVAARVKSSDGPAPDSA